jgi:hypothetical protein
MEDHMPMSAHQLAALVERAKLKAPPVVNPPRPPEPTTRAVRRRDSDNPSKVLKPVVKATAPATTTVATEPLAPIESAEPNDDFPTGWCLERNSWHFHRRFYAIFRRPMRRGEYSHLLWQIRRRTAEHLWEDCWRVKLPSGDRTLPVRATRWQLITILPKDWQPPQLGSTDGASRASLASAESAGTPEAARVDPLVSLRPSGRY